MALHSLQIEKHILGGLIQNQDVFPDIESFVSELDFVSQTHSVIYSCIKSSFLANEKIDKILLAQKIKNLGISFKDDINIFDYVENVSMAPISADSTIKACQELVKLRYLRQVEGICDEIKSHVNKSANQPIEQTVSEIDAIYGAKVGSFTAQKIEVNLFDGLLELAEERGNNPSEEIGFATPYKDFNKFYGGLRRRNLYIIAARAKAGKSTFLSEFCSDMSKIHKMPALYLDTENSTEEMRFKTIAAKTGVPLWYIETGNWRKNADMVTKVRTCLKDIGQSYKVTHCFIGNKKIEEIGSMCRRWYYKHVGRGNPCLICYDYIKMVDRLGFNQQEYQLMGDKVDFLKKLGEELDCPLLTAVQSNRSGITTNRDVSQLIDDESSIGISDRITWYATYVGILRRRVIDEVVMDTPQSGTHKLIEAVARFQGREAAGHQDLVKRKFPDGKERYVKNFLNFEIKNFKVDERGTIADSIARQNTQFLATSEEVEQEEVVL